MPRLTEAYHTEGDREQFDVYVLPPYPSSEWGFGVDCECRHAVSQRSGSVLPGALYRY